MGDERGSATPATEVASNTELSAGGAGFLALKSGLVMRHYVIEEVIGAGGFGITYRARHDRLTSKIFALKEFFPRQFAARQGTTVHSTPDGAGLFRWGLDRFLKEAEALARCEHPAIVHVVDYFEENGTAYAVLGYIEGMQFGQWLDALGRPPTQAELDQITKPLLDALQVVHAANLLHRDIAPDNILIRRDGSPCLIDFGACREDIRDRSRKVSAIVKHGYSPPEQYHGIAELQGPWTDIYALAATLYRAVSGQLPMDSSQRGTLGDGLKPAAETSTGDYRPAFLSAIDRALRLKPEERPQSVAEWRQMLFDDIGVEATITPSSPGAASLAEAPAPRQPAGASADPRPSPPTRSPAASRKGLTIVTIAALVLVGAGALAVLRTPPAPPPSAKSTEPRSDAREKKHSTAKSAEPSASQAKAPSRQDAASSSAPTDPEAAATTAWRTLAGSTDVAEIERFLATHGTSGVATEARAHLAALREIQRRKDAADAAARHQQTLDRNWQACRDAASNVKEAACASVIRSDDTTQRRATAFHLVGMATRSAGNYDEAIAAYSRALDLVPNDAQVLTDRGIAHFLKGTDDGRAAAMRDYDAAIRLDPRHAEALNNRAWSLFQGGHTAEALADADRSIQAEPANGYAYDTRGHILEALGRRDDAIRDYERALAIDPKQDASRTALDRLKPAAR